MKRSDIERKRTKTLTVEETNVTEHVKRVRSFIDNISALETHGLSRRTLASTSTVSCYAFQCKAEDG